MRTFIAALVVMGALGASASNAFAQAPQIQTFPRGCYNCAMQQMEREAQPPANNAFQGGALVNGRLQTPQPFVLVPAGNGVYAAPYGSPQWQRR